MTRAINAADDVVKVADGDILNLDISLDNDVVSRESGNLIPSLDDQETPAGDELARGGTDHFTPAQVPSSAVQNSQNDWESMDAVKGLNHLDGILNGEASSPWDIFVSVFA